MMASTLTPELHTCLYFTYLSFTQTIVGMEDVNRMNEIKHLAVTKEALVSKENIGDDGIGDEDWNVISAQRLESHFSFHNYFFNFLNFSVSRETRRTFII